MLNRQASSLETSFAVSLACPQTVVSCVALIRLLVRKPPASLLEFVHKAPLDLLQSVALLFPEKCTSMVGFV